LNFYLPPSPVSTLFSNTNPSLVDIFTYQKQAVFQNKYACELLLNIITYNKHALDYQVFGFVIMPDHLHIILKPRKVPLFQIVKKNTANFTRYFQKFTGTYEQIWAEDYYKLPINDYPSLQEIQEYIHNDPVRHKLVGNARNYTYSSYRYYNEDGENFMLLLDRLQPDEFISPHKRDNF